MNAGAGDDRGPSRVRGKGAIGAAKGVRQLPRLSSICLVGPLSLLLLRHQRVIDFLGAPRGWPIGETLPIPLRAVALLYRAELQAPADLRPEINIGGGKADVQQIAAWRNPALERIHDTSKAYATR